MGLFSSKYVTYVGTSISNFTDAKQFISSRKKGVISGIANKESMTEHMMDHLINSAGFRGKKAYKYSGDTYTFGRPKDTLFNKSTTIAGINSAINTYVTDTLGATAVYYTKYGAPNYYHKFYIYLQSVYGLNFFTNELPVLSASKGTEVTLHKATLLLNDANTLEDPDSFLGITAYPVEKLSTTAVSRVGTQMTYRWSEVEVLPEDTDIVVDGPNLISTTSVSFAGGPTNYTTTTEVVDEPVTVGPIDTYYTEPADPLNGIYDEIQVTRTSTVTSVFTETTVVTYTAATQTKVTRIYHTLESTDVFFLTKEKPTEETLVLSTDFTFTEEEAANRYYLAAYLVGGVVTFFTYIHGGGITSLDNYLNTSYSLPGSYMPRLYFRWEAQAGDVNPASIEYLHSKRMAKKLGVNYKDVVTGVHSLEGGRTQADLDQVKSVFLTWAIEADATTQSELKYLYKHFENWFGVVGGVTTTIPLITFNSTLASTDTFEHVLVIEDTRFKVSVGMQGIWKRTVTGSIGNVGTYGTDKGTLTFSFVEVNVDGELTSTLNHPWHVYRYQDTATTYIEYEVVGLETKYYVNNDHASASGYTENVLDPKDILYVPINYTIVETLKVFEQEELMYRAMKIVANSLVVQKVKWYQTEFWGFIFQAAALVAMFYGFSTGSNFLATLTTAASVSAVWAMELVFNALTKLLLKYVAVQLFVNALGENLAFLVAIAAAVYGYANQGFNIGLPYAQDLLAFSNDALKAISTSVGKKMKGLQQDMQSFAKEMEEKFDELEKIQEELDNPLNPLANILIGETPDDFYNRTVHSGNIGTRVFEMQENFVDMALELPRNNFTIEV